MLQQRNNPGSNYNADTVQTSHEISYNLCRREIR